MLSGLHIGNFKAFASTQHIPLKPLTLIFGPNSSGKSSIIHSLLFGHEAATSDDPNRLDVKRPRIGGESVDLGGFRHFVHRRNPSNQVEWGVDFETSELSPRLRELLGATEVVSVCVTVGIEQRQRTSRARISGTGEEVDVPSDVEQTSGPRIESYRIQVPDGVILRASMKGSGDRRRMGVDELDLSNAVLRGAIDAMVLMGTTTGSLREGDFDAIQGAIDELVPDLSLRGDGLLPSLVDWPKPEDSTTQAQLFPIGKGTRGEDLVGAVLFYLPRLLNDLVQGLESSLRETFRRTRYLGPLRSYPARHLAFSQDHDTNWQAGGGWAWDRVRTDAEVRRRVNEWLGSTKWMKTPYQLVVNNLYGESDISETLWTALERLGEDGLTIEPDYDRGPEPEGAFPAIKDIQREVDRHQELLGERAVETVQDLVLLDVQKKTVVSHRDIGIGVSQVLPVLVACFSAENQLLAMEQPELHLHPALQAELGDVFIEAAIKRQNTCVLETHSEHLILRILRRIREASQTDSDSRPCLTPEDVAVLYVEPRANESVVRVLELDDEGQFLDPWPDGFFEEGFRERFGV